jgi:hypothetical protein
MTDSHDRTGPSGATPPPSSAAPPPPERRTTEDLLRIVHIGEERATAIVTGRPWASVRSLTAIRGIADARIRDIEQQGLACVR